MKLFFFKKFISNNVMYILVFLLTISYTVFIIIVTNPTFSEITIVKLANFGNSFGMLATLFSGLAFAIMINTIKFQKETNVRQHFEAIFFNLLLQYNNQLLNVQIKNSNGREAFKEFYEELIVFFNNISSLKAIQEEADKDKKKKPLRYKCCNSDFILEIYVYYFYEKRIAKFGAYFRNLYTILNFIDDDNDIIDKNKKKYSKIIRSQLSPYELYILYYNCLTVGKEKFLPLINKYKILKDLDINFLIGMGEKNKEVISLLEKQLNLIELS